MEPCGREEYDAALALLDQEFIFGRGRRLSLQRRFPAVFDRLHPQNIFLSHAHGAIVSALVIKPLVWITPDRTWRAAMIGMVCTRPDSRGMGSASALLQAAQARLAGEGFDFAVLWAAQPGFYARLGWLGADCGSLGTLKMTAHDTSETLPPPDAQAITFVESLRRRCAPERAERSDASYATLLPHAGQLELLRGDSAYAIVGRQGDHGYLYEMTGAAGEYATLWARLATRYRSLYLNVQHGSAAECFLSGHQGIEWRPQQLAMWLPLAAAARDAPFSRWYIPFLDRI